MRVISDTGLVAGRQLRQTLSSWPSVFIGLLQPFLFLVLFGPLLATVLGEGETESWLLFVPGILVMLALFSAGYSGFAVFPDLHSGFQERMRVTPVHRISLLLGRITQDVVIQLVQAAIILIAASIFWLRAPLLGVVVCLVFVVLLTIACSALSYALALKLRAEYVFAPVISTAVIPIMLLSGILMPMSLAPAWLNVVSYLNPFRHIVDAIRAAFTGEYGSSEFLVGSAVAVGLAVACLYAGTRSFTREQA